MAKGGDPSLLLQAPYHILLIHAVGTGAVLGAAIGMLRRPKAPLTGIWRGATHGIMGAIAFTVFKTFFKDPAMLQHSAKRLEHNGPLFDPFYHFRLSL
eukprot:GGOE01065016.1.p2 GENE.GGOE01065016.1~~GGOE01065016.1.p2  ORF type:complete len:112 (+),score=35.94 GGOE01065016.1:43-336(+)